jgi:deoxyribose-phosphate aldolase
MNEENSELKKKSKEFNTSHPMKLGYDFVKFSIGFSKRERKNPKGKRLTRTA